MVVLEYGAAEICVDVTGNVWEDIWVVWLIVCLEMIPCTRWVLQPYTTVFLQQHPRTDFISVSRSGRARAGDAFYYFNDAYCRPVTSALELWPRRSPHRHGAPSPSFVLRYRALTAASSVRPAADLMTYSGRPPRPRPHRHSSSAVQPRDVSSTLTNLSDILPNNNINWTSVGTYILIVVIPSLSEAQHRTVSRSQFLKLSLIHIWRCRRRG